MQYRVVWTIDVDAESPSRAAAEALRVQRDPGSIATVFLVVEMEGNEDEYMIDVIRHAMPSLSEH